MKEQTLRLLETLLAMAYGLRRKIATAAVGILAGMLAFHAIFGANGLIVFEKKRAEHRALLLENESLQKENERLTQQVRALKTDPKTIEKEAREQLRYARPGEVVYTLPASRPPVNAATAQGRANP